MTSPGRSPPLPPFSIRDLFEHSSEPSLISITAGQYRSTLESQPDAFLRYIDDDDGELVMIGSVYELEEKLQEEVKSDATSVRNPLDGELVHVFDIARSRASLARWRDYQGRSSEYFSSQMQSSRLTQDAEGKHKDFESLEQPHAEQVLTGNQSDDSAAVIADKIVTGLEFHLDGLASILHGAADTLQKAAQRTRDTDTSIVEDILTGVRGIFTEVGALGNDLLKTLDPDEVDAAVCPESGPVDRSQIPHHKVTPGFSTSSVSSRSSNSVSSFDLHENNTLPANVHTLNSRHRHQAAIPSTCSSAAKSAVEPCTTSILDGDADDLAFAARYPPLQSIRRTQNFGAPAQRYQPYASRAQPETIWTPFVSAPRRSDGSTADVSDLFRPLPGAWPEAKVETVSTLPASKESSGAFFNRMTGRMRQCDEESATKPSVLPHRANTTASANPASRLNGPFNPDLPYPHLPRKTESFWRPAAEAMDSASTTKRPKLTLKTPVPLSADANLHDLNYGLTAPRTDIGLHRAHSVPHLISSSHADQSTSAREQMKPVWAWPARDPPSISAELSPILETTLPPNHSTNADGHTVPWYKIRPARTHTSVASACTSKSTPRTCDLADTHTVREPAQGSTSVPSSQRSPPANITDPLSGHAMWKRLEDRVRSHMDSGAFNLEAHFARQPYEPWPYVHSTASHVGQSVGRMPTGTSASASTSNSNSSGSGGSSSGQSQFVNHNSGLESRSSVVSTISQPIFGSSDQSSSTSNPHAWAAQTDFTTHTMPAGSMEPTMYDSDKARNEKLDLCISQLRDFGYGCADPNLADRLIVYAVASDGDVLEAVDMIEEDRRLSCNF